jgi:hypothetical protein
MNIPSIFFYVIWGVVFGGLWSIIAAVGIVPGVLQMLACFPECDYFMGLFGFYWFIIMIAFALIMVIFGIHLGEILATKKNWHKSFKYF